MVISKKIFYMVVSLFMNRLYSLFTLLEKGSDTVKMLKSKNIYKNDQMVISKKIFCMVVSLSTLPLTMTRRFCRSRTRNKCKPLKSLVALFISYLLYTEKFKLSTPQSLGLWFSKCQRKWNISISHYEKIEKWPPFHISRKLEISIFCWLNFPIFPLVQFSPITHPRFHFYIYAWLRLKHLCMDIYVW